MVSPRPPLLQSPLFTLHVVSMLFAYASFALACVLGVTYVLLFKEIKAKHLGFFYARLPSLQVLDVMNGRVVTDRLAVPDARHRGRRALGDADPVARPDPRAQAMSIGDPKILVAIISWARLFVRALRAPRDRLERTTRRVAVGARVRHRAAELRADRLFPDEEPQFLESDAPSRSWPQPSHGARRVAGIRRLRAGGARRGARTRSPRAASARKPSCSRPAIAPRSTPSATPTRPPTRSARSSATITASTPSRLAEHLYCHRGVDAARHLFRVAAGLDSLVVGEPQILGQVKTAYATASDLQFTGTVTHRLFHAAFAVGKRVRSETGLGEGAVSVSYAAIALAKKIFGDLTGLNVLILGAGEMAKLTGVHLQAQRVKQITIASRTLASAESLARQLEGRAVAVAGSPQRRSPPADIVVTATGAAEPVLTRAIVEEAMRSRRRPAAVHHRHRACRATSSRPSGDLDQVFLYHIDDLQSIVNENLARRSARAGERRSDRRRGSRAVRVVAPVARRSCRRSSRCGSASRASGRPSSAASSPSSPACRPRRARASTKSRA